MDATESPSLRIVPFAGAQGADSSRVHPLVTAAQAPFHEALRDGRLLLPACASCTRMRLPGFPRCPWCGHAETTWREHAGRGRVHSWTRYHRSFMSEFDALVPYAVAAVALDDGPTLIGRVLAGTPKIDAPARAVIEAWLDGFRCIAFELPQEGTR